MQHPPGLVEVAFRYSLIAPLLDPQLSRAEKELYRRSVLRRGHEHPTRGPLRISARTLRRWLHEFRKQGTDGLHPRVRKDQGPRVLESRHLEHAIFLLRENPRRDSEFLIAELEREFPDLKGRVGRSTLNRHLHAQGVNRRAIPDEQADGPPYHAFQASEPNALWHSDFHHGPSAIVDGRVVATRIFAWIDDFSRACCHCQAYPDESLPCLEDCMKQALQKFGVPRRVYTDLGSIYSGVQFGLICADLSIAHVDARPYSPWTHGKIERLWGVQEDDLWSEIRLLPPIPIAQLNRYLQAWVEADYHKRLHSKTNEAPLARWHAHRPAIRYPTPEQIQRLFWLWERRKVSSTGVVQLCRNSYFVDPALAGRTVIVRYDPFDLQRIQVWSMDRKPSLLCEGTASPLLVRRRLQPPPPRDTAKPSAAARRHLDQLEQRYQQHLAESLHLIRYDTPNEEER